MVVKSKNEEYNILLRQIEKYKKSLEIVNDNIRESHYIKDSTKKYLKKLEDRIGEIKESELVLSEHAFVRFFERVIGISIEDIKNQIITENLVNQLKITGGTGTYPTTINLTGYDPIEVNCVIRNNEIITITKK